MLEARAAAALLLLFVVPLLGATVRPSPAVESRLNLEKYYQALSLHNAGAYPFTSSFSLAQSPACSPQIALNIIDRALTTPPRASLRRPRVRCGIAY